MTRYPNELGSVRGLVGISLGSVTVEKMLILHNSAHFNNDVNFYLNKTKESPRYTKIKDIGYHDISDKC